MNNEIIINGVGPILGSPTTNSRCYLEITLNYPRTAGFKNMTSDKQKGLYSRLLQLIKCTFGPTGIERCEHTFEFCKSGHVHLHASIIFVFSTIHIPIGVVSDVVKTYLNQLPKRYSVYQEGCMHIGFIRYRSPSIAVQYTSFEDKKRIDIWNKYINKYQ